jgi:hypothetical protein
MLSFLFKAYFADIFQYLVIKDFTLMKRNIQSTNIFSKSINSTR